jgi:CDP-glucose 4,6-dehydratase
MSTEFWNGRSVLVTGATGLLGGWLVKELLSRGAEVTALVRDGAPRSLFHREQLYDRVNVVNGSLELDVMRRTIAEYSVKTVIHLAAQTLVGIAKVNPVGTFEANIRGTWSVLEAARTTNMCQVIVASSDKAYGDSLVLPYVETHPMDGRYPYDVSKSCTDLITRMYHATYELPVGVLRCGNLFGGGDLNFSRTIPGVILATLKGERFRIRSDGTYVRDFLYVEDAADAYLLVAQSIASNPDLAGEAFNFSLGVRPTVLEVARMVLKLMGAADVDPIIENTAKGEIREQYTDSRKARQLLAWRPRYGLEEGLRRTIDWYRAYFELNMQKPTAAAARKGRPEPVAAGTHR